MSVLLRLLDPLKGTVSIGGQDISKVPRNVVRSGLICLPQDPLLFPDTFLVNLDPRSEMISVSDIESILKRVQLWGLVQDRGGLDSTIVPESLSHGEQQLLALGQAILRKRTLKGERCILILDEATSNLDLASEKIFHQVVREEFKNDTVITVAHRLETLKDNDLILVLEKGRVSKIGTPTEVLDQKFVVERE